MNRTFHVVEKTIFSIVLLIIPILLGNLITFVCSQDSLQQSDTSLSIQSDMDLENYATRGSGTINDPYILRFSIYEHEHGTIEVSNTRSYFIISNTNIWNYVLSDYVLLIRNVTHGSIEQSIVRSYDRTSGTGILVEDSSDITITSSSIDHCGSGIEISESSNCVISNCNVYENYRGLRLIQTSNIQVLWNTIVFNEGEGIIASGVNNSIYGNEIGWNLQSAEDYGSDNFWDNGVDTGNLWDDYDGIGDYEVPGQEDSADHYPILLQDGDYSPPNIEHHLPYGGPTAEIIGFSINQVKISAYVSDPSEVDTVYLISTFNGTMSFYEMIPDSSVENNSYSYIFEGPFSGFGIQYFIWANDTNGYSQQTDYYGFSVHPTILPLVIPILIFSGVVCVALIFYIRK